MKMTEKEVLCYLKDMLIVSLDELQDFYSDDENQFAYGEKTAYVECLEWLQSRWEEAKENDLDFNIEKRYSLGAKNGKSFQFLDMEKS